MARGAPIIGSAIGNAEYRLVCGSLPAALTDYHNTCMRTHLIKYGFEQKEVAYLGIF